MNIVICDEQRLFMDVFSALLQQRGHCVTAQTAMPELAVKMVERGDVDVCVMDMGFRSTESLDAVVAMARDHHDTKVVILTDNSHPLPRNEARAAGARACLSKNLDADTVIDLLEAIDAGVDVDLIHDAETAAGPWTGQAGSVKPLGAQFLTEREQQVLTGLAYGESTSELAARLGVRQSTARTHVENLLSKLGVHSRVAAVAFALEHSLIDFRR